MCNLFSNTFLVIQTTAILQAYEKIYEVTKPGCVLKSFDWNQLASNNPLGDSLATVQLWDNKSIGPNHYFTSKSYSIISLYSKVTCWVFSTAMEVRLAPEFWPNVSSLTLQPPSLLNKSQPRVLVTSFLSSPRTDCGICSLPPKSSDW